ncbi:TPA: ZPR1 zinc finger domain-containing protein [Candidatus Woesearchaeota archaeon]|nr:ZPR1 zinc finger domain-containing protein [Candidatus Woesearchaeota archaeon]HII68388.1 ZPR1 zinc finger domain-containing protein [Candidatus Woesearchaeota archaeon]
MSEEAPDVLEGQPCPMCHAKTLTLMESERDVPYFGKVYLFSMNCASCKYHLADVETESENPPVKYALDISSEEDMKIRVVKSSQATVKLPHIATITPGSAASGYVTNVEGILNRVRHQIESARDAEDDDPEAKKKAKSLLKKITKIQCGHEKQKLIIDDPSGNSAIISDKAEKSELK